MVPVPVLGSERDLCNGTDLEKWLVPGECAGVSRDSNRTLRAFAELVFRDTSEQSIALIVGCTIGLSEWYARNCPDRFFDFLPLFVAEAWSFPS